MQKTVLDDKLHWYKDAIIYELHIKAFRDGNGDGIGDFQGLMEKLDYLETLGVTAIWVLPFYPSPLRDDGYDIADYYKINPSYGDIKEFQRFLKEAHRRNLKVITELVINHTSDQHPWFQRARKAPKGSVEREYYVWTDDPTTYKDVRIIFQDFETSNWTWDSEAQQYYWHRFFHHQPDLNYDNPKVQEEVFKIIDYWCKMGVDGFRLDAVPYLYEREGTNGENLPETHAFLKKLRAHVDSTFPGTVFLAEANMWPEDSASYFGDGDECHMNYHFPVMPRMFMALQMEDRYPITDIFDQTPDIPETCQWAIFLRNHDELTLEMVTDEERDYMYKAYAKDPKAKINLGIRHRLAPLMENNRRKIELLNCLLFSLSGTPVIYYGDEIGMGDNFYLGDRDGVRTPMQWSSDRNAGFSETNPQRLYLPIILDPEYHYESVNVDTQRRNPSSLFWFMKRIINMRKRYKSFSRGDMKFINVSNPKILAFTRTYNDEIMLVVVNLSRYSQPAELYLGDYKGYRPVEVFSKNKFPIISGDTPYFFTLGPFSYDWFLLNRTQQQEQQEAILPSMKIGKWKDLAGSEAVEELETSVLPGYLMQSQWFEGKDRDIVGVTVSEMVHIPLDTSHVYFLLIEVQYESGFPETYHLPLGLLTDHGAKKVSEHCPQAIVAKIMVGDTEGYLCDALYILEVQQFILNKMAKSQEVELKKGILDFEGTKELKKYQKETAEVKSRLQSTIRSYSVITYNNDFYLKMYRLVDRTTNPDVEMTRYLSEKSKLPQVPRFAGQLEWKIGKTSVVLGMMQHQVESHGDGRIHILERVNAYMERLLSMDKAKLPKPAIHGTWIEPVPFESMSANMQELFGGPVSEAASMIGRVTGQMHKGLANSTEKDFDPEEFSLHYQRSLFSGLQTQVRVAFTNQASNLSKLDENTRKETEEVLAQKDKVLNILKRIYAKKFDVKKIRIHGNYLLQQIVFTGKDIAFVDFSGDPTRSYSDRRLKRSPLRDVAGMVRAFHYRVYEGMLLNNNNSAEEKQRLEQYAKMWAHYVTGFFMHEYLAETKGSSFIPADKADLEILLDTFVLEKAIFSLHYELNHRPEWVIVPVRLIKSIIDKH